MSLNDDSFVEFIGTGSPCFSGDIELQLLLISEILGTGKEIIVIPTISGNHISNSTEAEDEAI